MAHRKSITLIVVSLLLVIPLFCEAFDQHDRETDDPGSGEAEVPSPHLRPAYEAIPDEGEEDDENQSVVSQGQDQEETDQQSTPSSVSVVGKENMHLSREPEVEESDETTTLVSSAVPLAPVPPEEEDPHQPPRNETLNPEPSRKIVIWDGAGEPDREQSTNPPEEPANQPEQPTPVSQELHGGANGNGQPKDIDSHEADKSRQNEPQHSRPRGKPIPVTSSGSASSSIAWVVVFAVVSSALLISGVILGIVIVSNRSKRKTSKGAAMSDTEADKTSSCHRGCRHNFDDFNPYAWPPTPVSRNEFSLRPIT